MACLISFLTYLPGKSLRFTVLLWFLSQNKTSDVTIICCRTKTWANMLLPCEYDINTKYHNSFAGLCRWGAERFPTWWRLAGFLIAVLAMLELGHSKQQHKPRCTNTSTVPRGSQLPGCHLLLFSLCLNWQIWGWEEFFFPSDHINSRVLFLFSLGIKKFLAIEKA